MPLPPGHSALRPVNAPRLRKPERAGTWPTWSRSSWFRTPLRLWLSAALSPLFDPTLHVIVLAFVLLWLAHSPRFSEW